MKERKLNYRFHNPNTPEAAASWVTKVLIDANRGKVERAIQNASDEITKQKKKKNRGEMEL